MVRVAARTGYAVINALVGRNHGQMGTVRGVMRHHTGTGVNYKRLDDYPTLKVVQVGRPDLGGPLCTWGIGRSGAIYVVNDQIAWHAGAGIWRGVTDGNGHFWAIEAESDGTYWTPALTDSYHRLVASALYELGLGFEWAPRHAGYARPVGRKTDTAGMDEALFEQRVTAMLADPRTINRNYKPAGSAPAQPVEDDVSAKDVWAEPIEVPKAQQADYHQKVYTAEQMLLGANYWAQRAAKQTAGLQAALVTVTRLLADGNTVQPDELEAALDRALAPVLAALPEPGTTDPATTAGA